MDIEKEITGNQLLVKASGRIDASTAAEYGSSITDSIEDGFSEENMKIELSINCSSNYIIISIFSLILLLL